jgi:hypothetical protein
MDVQFWLMSLRPRLPLKTGSVSIPKSGSGNVRLLAVPDARAPMTLANMRQNGVRNTLAVYCGGRWCDHHRVLDVSGYADDVSVPSFGPRMVCTVCGAIAADARPNWNERNQQAPITRASSAP